MSTTAGARKRDHTAAAQSPRAARTGNHTGRSGSWGFEYLERVEWIRSRLSAVWRKQTKILPSFRGASKAKPERQVGGAGFAPVTRGRRCAEATGYVNSRPGTCA